MGIDINSYRCRVGMFVPGGGRGFNSLFFTFGRVVKLLGSLTLIRILLVMAGIELNPGPVDKYIFRYQYLLIEIGTNVMRRIFDVRVGNDFVQYLSANNTENRNLQKLISKKIITADQTRYLPPMDNSPKSSNFDITLLSCLLRNVCGLRGHQHPVWKNPVPPADFSLEADLARLKECRNNLQHKGTVFISKTDFKVKWNELIQILTRLNAISGIPNLSVLTNAAEKMGTDEEMKKRFDESIKAWIKMENDIEEMKLYLSEFKRKLEHKEQTKGYKRKPMDMVESDLRNRLVKIKKEECCTLPVTPLCDEDYERHSDDGNDNDERCPDDDDYERHSDDDNDNDERCPDDDDYERHIDDENENDDHCPDDDDYERHIDDDNDNDGHCPDDDDNERHIDDENENDDHCPDDDDYERHIDSNDDENDDRCPDEYDYERHLDDENENASHSPDEDDYERHIDDEYENDSPSPDQDDYERHIDDENENDSHSPDEDDYERHLDDENENDYHSPDEDDYERHIDNENENDYHCPDDDDYERHLDDENENDDHCPDDDDYERHIDSDDDENDDRCPDEDDYERHNDDENENDDH